MHLWHLVAGYLLQVAAPFVLVSASLFHFFYRTLCNVVIVFSIPLGSCHFGNCASCALFSCLLSPVSFPPPPHCVPPPASPLSEVAQCLDGNLTQDARSYEWGPFFKPLCDVGELLKTILIKENPSKVIFRDDYRVVVWPNKLLVCW